MLIYINKHNPISSQRQYSVPDHSYSNFVGVADTFIKEPYNVKNVGPGNFQEAAYSYCTMSEILVTVRTERQQNAKISETSGTQMLLVVLWHVAKKLHSSSMF